VFVFVLGRSRTDQTCVEVNRMLTGFSGTKARNFRQMGVWLLERMGDKVGMESWREE
jgi:predicted HAD superfamily phosphohydrolase YqeG